MDTRITRRGFVSVFGTFIGTAAWGLAPTTSLRPKLRPTDLNTVETPPVGQLLVTSNLAGLIGFAVTNAKTGAVAEDYNSTRPLPPASVAKALTALYALDRLGANHQFTTRVVATGPVENGVLKGDLVLMGGADPTLDTDGLARLAAAVKATGVTEVRGKFLYWTGALPYERQIDKSQPEQTGYNPAISGIALNFNRVHFEWKPAGGKWAITMDARTEKYRPGVTSAKMKIAARDVPVYTYEDKAGVDQWTVARSALGKGGARWLPVRHPGTYAADVFRTMARAHGISLPKGKETSHRPAGQTLAAINSDTLQNIIKAMLRYSTNITAEMVGMAATAGNAAPPRNLRDSARQMSQWAKAKFGVDSVALVDHSGLGEASKITAHDMVQILNSSMARRQLRPLLKKVTMRDANGKTDKSNPLQVVAKTGTLNFVSALAGYVSTPKGEDLAFAYFSADLKTRGAIKKADRERPPGGRTWNRKSKALQQRLLNRWGQF